MVFLEKNKWTPLGVRSSDQIHIDVSLVHETHCIEEIKYTFTTRFVMLNKIKLFFFSLRRPMTVVLGPCEIRHHMYLRVFTTIA